MIFRLFMLLCILGVACSPWKRKYQNIAISPKFLSKTIALPDKMQSLQIYDFNLDGQEDISFIVNESIFLYHVENRSINIQKIKFSEKIVLFNFFSYLGKIFIIVVSQRNIYHVDLKNNTKKIIARTPQYFKRTQKNSFMKLFFFPSKKTKDFLFLYQKNLSWFCNLYFWKKDGYFLKDVIKIKEEISIPQISILPNKKIIIYTSDKILHFEQKKSKYILVKTTNNSKMAKTQSIFADLNHNDKLDEINLSNKNNNIQIKIDTKTNLLFIPGISIVNINIIDINNDGWLDILILSISKKSPSLASYIFSGTLPVDFTIYEFKNKHGSFDKNANKKHHYKIHFPVNNKKQEKKVLYCNDIDNDGFIDVIEKVNEKLFFYYNIVPKFNKLPVYTLEIWQKMYKKSYLSGLIHLDKFPETIVSLPILKGTLKNIHTLKSKYFHDLVMLQFEHNAVFLFPF